MDEDLGPLDMFQELDAQPMALVGAFDDPGDVGDDEAVLAVGVDNAEMGNQGRERIVGDDRPGRGDLGDQRRLADVGESDQPDVGDELQLQEQLALFPVPAGLVLAGTWWVARAKEAFPRPPFPPAAASNRWPARRTSKRSFERLRP